MIHPFTPATTAGKTLTAGTTTARVALATSGDKLVVTNLGPDDCFIELGDVTIEAAVNTGLCILPYSQIVLSRNTESHTNVAAISDTGKSATLKLCTGHGF